MSINNDFDRCMSNGRTFQMRTIRELFDLSGQVALVTGGATGIGRQMATALGEAGAHLVIASRKLEVLTEAAEAMEKELGVKVLPVQCNITVHEEIDALFDRVMKEFGRLDIVINNSGATWGAPSLEFPLKGWQTVIDTNVTGVWIMCQKAGQIMSKQKYGRIINIGSIASFVGAKAEVMDAISYQTSKAAIVGLTKDLAVKWAQHNITVNALAPGWFPTKLTSYTLEHHEKDLLQFIPMGRLGGDDELKAATLFLASQGASYVTGVILSVDGGWVAM
jgi:NAD(P)-dependent dehydrogenase (short-subunit alcohol dehydrogenase family)